MFVFSHCGLFCMDPPVNQLLSYSSSSSKEVFESEPSTLLQRSFLMLHPFTEYNLSTQDLLFRAIMLSTVNLL